MLVGKGMPSLFRKMCLVHSEQRVIHTSRTMDEGGLAGMRRMAAATRRVGSLSC